ncbi:hypothetical protein NUW54_g202 [Trametes sanguinea]|uniref:Uncharacterized protein n=1 Tax=Trametes sanguinea TaxID=158606 RepID=A0ACC1QBP4_9APHY|nr:hypothetical protein NUW54_g202 [Trametes sanguinea]
MGRIARITLNFAALTAQGFRLLSPEKSDNPIYRIHTFAFLRETQEHGTERLIVRVVQAMQRNADDIEFRVSYQVSSLGFEEVLERDAPSIRRPAVRQQHAGKPYYPNPWWNGMVCVRTRG